ncbi:MAG: terminase gpA endonuclease subunit [Planctomycetota bacterium]
MAPDLRKLRPSELVRLLNSTPLGAVLDEKQFHRQRVRAGYRLGQGRTVDLFRYIAWIAQEKHRPREMVDPGESYAKAKRQVAERNTLISEAGREIGELPHVDNPTRKQEAKTSFKKFCEAYFPLTFSLPWSADHLKVMAKVEQSVLQGGLFAMAMPRASGKSSIAECACLWATLYGHRDFVCLIGASEAHAQEMLESLKMELEGNDALHADFPEVCFPIRALHGIANRCSGQIYGGERTHIGWTASEVVLPTIAGSSSSGAVIKVTGLTGRIRGLKFKKPDGHTVRPSLVVLDDPQTDESARSLSQCAAREKILAGAVLGLAGPGKKIAGIMPCTVIRPGDMADHILDPKLHPEWNAERTKMVYRFPTAEKLWTAYAEVRAESLRRYGDLREATAFYKAHREDMDEGSLVAWPERFNPDEASALQHAMNLRLQDEGAFFAEYQNEPLAEKDIDDEGLLTVDQIASKLSGYARGVVPIGVTTLTSFIDVQGKLLYWVVCGFHDDFTAHVLDYGAYPEQKRPYFTLRDAQRTLGQVAKGAGQEGAIYAGLEALTGSLLGREWRREDGAFLKVGRCLIDANWGTSTDVVYEFCRRSPHAAGLLPSHGRFVGASSRPFHEYAKRPGDRVGLNWRIPTTSGKRAIRHVLYDTNFWKTFVHARLAVAMGDKGCLALFGRDPLDHRMFAEHLTSEYRVKTEGRGRVVDEWKLRPEHVDNHLLDCLVGSCVAASIEGAVLAGTSSPTAHKRQRIKLSTFQGKKR